MTDAELAADIRRTCTCPWCNRVISPFAHCPNVVKNDDGSHTYDCPLCGKGVLERKGCRDPLLRHGDAT